MNSRDDIYSKEAALINRSRRELADGTDKDPIYKLRLQCLTKGPTGILDVAKVLNKTSNSEGQVLDFDAFKNGIRQTGLDCRDEEIKKMFENLDANKKGCIDSNEFMDKLRPPMTRQRLNVVDKAFEKCDTNCKGAVSFKDLKTYYNVKNNPKYLSGDLTEQQILNQFISNFKNANEKSKDQITKEEFVNYYSTVSAAIDNDAYFDLMMRRDYKL